MQFHDYHLQGYRVEGFGALVTLDLVYDYPGEAIRQSTIQFQGVKLYHFIHTAGAIITSIDEMPLPVLLSEHRLSIETWAKEQGIADWRTDSQQLLADWSALALKAWRIVSAIGFSGFVVAASIT